MLKSEARNLKRAERAALGESYRAAASDIIADRVISSPEYKRAKSIFCYVSFADEVCTERIISDALSTGKAVYVPRLKDGEMLSVRITERTEYYSGCYEISEPYSDETGYAELAIVPLIGFNGRRERIGYGKGYYDRYFSKTGCFKLGIAFASGRADFDGEPHDVRLDKIVTEKEIL